MMNDPEIASAPQRTWEKFVDLFSFPKNNIPVEKSSKKTEAQHQLSKNAASDADSSIVDVSLASQRSNVACVQILNLEPLKERVGERWAEVASRIHMVVENTLSHGIGRKDLYFGLNDNAYAIVFSELDTDQAERKTESLIAELMRILFASDADIVSMNPGISIEARLLKVDFEGVGNLEDLRTRVADFSNSSSTLNNCTHREKNGVRETVVATENELQALLEKFEANNTNSEALMRIQNLLEQLRSIEAKLPAATRVLREDAKKGALKSGPDGNVSSLICSIVASTEGNLRKILETYEKCLSSDDCQVDDDVTWKSSNADDFSYVVDYLPVVDIRTTIVAVHTARIRVQPTNTSINTSFDAPGDEAKSLLRKLDRLLVESVLRGLNSEGAASQIISIGINAASLEILGIRRSFLMQYASRIPLALRGSIAFEILLDQTVNTAEVSAWIEEIAPYCRAIFLRLARPLDVKIFAKGNLTSRAASKLAAVGFSVPRNVDEVKFQADVAHLVSLTESRSIRSYVTNVPKQSIFLNLVGAGVGYVSSENMFPPAKFPASPRRTSLSELLRGRSSSSL